MIRAVNFAKTFPYSIAVGVALALVHQWVTAPPYLYYQNLPFPAVMERVAPGSAVALSVERCNSSDKTHSYNTTHALTPLQSPSEDILLPDVRVEIEPGCHRSVSKINVIPLGVKPGVYRVHGVATVDGWFFNRSVPWYSESFEVVQ